MNPIKAGLLWASESPGMRKLVPKLPFVDRAVKRFMPGEDVEAALAASADLVKDDIATTLTYLGESVANPDEAAAAFDHYTDVLDRILARGLDTEISVKLTQLGLDLDTELARKHLHDLAEHAVATENWVWIDIEQSQYVERTIDLYRSARTAFPNVGLCLQAYLRRTPADIESLLPLKPGIRLVKGAYKEPKEIAVTSKADIDKAFYDQSVALMGALGRGLRLALASHDIELMKEVFADSAVKDVSRDAYEIQMLYGIRTGEQRRLVEDGYRVRTLISYGEAWYSWYVRRLAERPANLGLAVRNVLPFGNK